MSLQKKEGIMKRVYFIRKAINLEELKTNTKWAIENKAQKETYSIRKTIFLDAGEFMTFTRNLTDDFDFLKENTTLCGPGIDEYINCLAIKNNDTDEMILVNTEGYSYARFTALLPGSDLNE